MNDELAKMQLQLDRLTDEFRAAQRTIHKLESRSAWRRPNLAALIVLIGATALFTGLWSAKASSGNERRTAVSPDTPTKVKAPFEVDDDNGIPIMVVRDQANQDANVGRGVYVIDQARKAVVRLGTTDDDGGGGMIMVTETGPMMTSTGGQVNGVQIIGTQEKSTLQVVRGGKQVASIGAEQGDKGGVESGGSVQVFGANEKPIVTLSKGKNGGELNVYDAKNKKAATLGTETSGGSLKMYGSGDKPTATLGTESDGGTLKVFASGDKPKGTFSAESDGGSLKIFGSSEKPKASLGVESDGGKLDIFGTSEKAVATLRSDSGFGKLSIGNSEGTSVAEIVSDATGGIVRVMKSGDPTTYTSINAIDKGNGLKIRKAGADMAFVGASSDGGTVETYNAAGDLVSALSTIDGKGLIAVFSGKHAIAFLTESDKHPGGGNITVTDPGGSGIFSAGFTGEGGDVCIDRKSSLKCLGIGLPLQINP